MPRGRSLTAHEIGLIEAYHDQGLSNRKIAARVGRSLCVVNNFLRDPVGYGTAPRSGRPPKLDQRDKRRIVRRASNSTVSGSQIQRELELPVTPQTVRNVLRSSPHIVRARMRKAPMLTELHKERRLDFARNNINRDWTKVIWSDEKRFKLDGPDSFNGYWHDLRKEKLRFSTRNFGGGGLMVWAAFNGREKLQHAFVSNRMDSAEYQEMLDVCLVPYFEEHDEDGLVFQQDGAPAHRNLSTRNWLAARQIDAVVWPACSPDLNPMENVWGILVHCIYAENKVYNNLVELRQAIGREWRRLDFHVLENLNGSMNRRCEQVISRQGAATDY